jgi:hypothetical protein
LKHVNGVSLRDFKEKNHKSTVHGHDRGAPGRRS